MMSAAADRGAGCTLYTCKLGIYRTWLYIVKYVYDYTTMAPAWHGLTCYCTSVPVVCRMRYMSMSVSFWNIRLDARILGEVAPVRGRVHSRTQMSKLISEEEMKMMRFRWGEPEDEQLS